MQGVTIQRVNQAFLNDVIILNCYEGMSLNTVHEDAELEVIIQNSEILNNTYGVYFNGVFCKRCASEPRNIYNRLACL